MPLSTDPQQVSGEIASYLSQIARAGLDKLIMTTKKPVSYTDKQATGKRICNNMSLSFLVLNEALERGEVAL